MRLWGLAMAGWLVLAGPALAQTGPYYRMVTPPQQTPLPWHAQPSPAARMPLQQAQPQQAMPSLDRNYQALRQSRLQEQRQIQRSARMADTVRRLDR